MSIPVADESELVAEAEDGARAGEGVEAGERGFSHPVSSVTEAGRFEFMSTVKGFETERLALVVSPKDARLVRGFRRAVIRNGSSEAEALMPFIRQYMAEHEELIDGAHILLAREIGDIIHERFGVRISQQQWANMRYWGLIEGKDFFKSEVGGRPRYAYDVARTWDRILKYLERAGVEITPEKAKRPRMGYGEKFPVPEGKVAVLEEKDPVAREGRPEAGFRAIGWVPKNE